MDRSGIMPYGAFHLRFCVSIRRLLWPYIWTSQSKTIYLRRTLDYLPELRVAPIISSASSEDQTEA